MKHIGWLFALIGAALAMGYVLNRLDWFHNDANDYAMFESQHD